MKYPLQLLALLQFVLAINTYGQTTKSYPVEVKVHLINENDLSSKDVQIAVEIKNLFKKTLNIPQTLYWGFMKQDEFSDLVVEVKRKNKDSLFEDFFLVDKFDYLYSAESLEKLRQYETKSSTFNIAQALEHSYFPICTYKVRVRFNGKRCGISRKIYSNWIEFEIK
jgi:hypothetical protein